MISKDTFNYYETVWCVHGNKHYRDMRSVGKKRKVTCRCLKKGGSNANGAVRARGLR